MAFEMLHLSGRHCRRRSHEDRASPILGGLFMFGTSNPYVKKRPLLIRKLFEPEALPSISSK